MEEKEKTRLNVLAYASPSLYGDFAKYFYSSENSALNLVMQFPNFDLLNATQFIATNDVDIIIAEPNEVFGRIFMMLSQSEQGRHLDRYRAANLAAGTLSILVTLQIHGSRRSVHSIVEYSGKLVNEDTTPEPEIVPIFMNEGRRYRDLGPMLRGSCFAQKFEDAGMPEYTYTTQPLPGQSAGKGKADE